MQAPKFTIRHVGINHKNAEEAEQTLALAMDLFSLPRGHENDSHIFAGTLFEIMKNENYGTYGHVALQVEDMDEAIAYFAEKGVGLREATIRRNAEGKIVFAYLDKELAGFALHLTV